MGLSIPSVPATIAALTAEEVWDYATKNLTNPAAAQDLANMLPGISPTATGRAARLDLITAARLAELDPANIPGDIDTLLAALSVHALDLGIHDVDVKALLEHATYGLSELARTSMLEAVQLETEWSTDPIVENKAAAAEEALTIHEISAANFVYPDGATEVRVILLALITAQAQASATHHIGLKVRRDINDGGWADLKDFTANPPFGLPVEGAVANWVMPIDISALVASGDKLEFRFTVTSDNAGSVNYTTSFIVVLVYTMG